MRKIGGILLAVGLITMLGTACVDDSKIMQGMNPSFESLLIEVVIGMSLVVTGFVLMKYSERNENYGARKKFRK